MLTGLSDEGDEGGALTDPPLEVVGADGEDRGMVPEFPGPGSITRTIGSRPTSVLAGALSRYGFPAFLLAEGVPTGLVAAPPRPTLPGAPGWLVTPDDAPGPETATLRAAKLDEDGPVPVAAIGMLMRSPGPAGALAGLGMVEVLGNPKLPSGG